MEIDYSVYLVTDRRILQGRDLLDAVAEAIEEVSPSFNSEKRRCPAGSFTRLP